MSLLNHPNVVKILCSFVERQELWIIMPLLQAGSCAAIMKQIAPKGFKDDALLATILYNTLCGLAYLHKDGRIHRDVKAGNILIGGQGDVQLADFGVAGTLMENGDRKKHRQTFTGTPCWMAPEVMEQASGYDEKADIWSFGITALELAYGYAPYARYQPMKVMLLTLQEDPPTAELYNDKSYSFNKHFHSMVGKCLKKDSTRRPSARKLMEHKFFRLIQPREYIRDEIVKRLPKPQRKNQQPIDINRANRRRDTNTAASGQPAADSSETAGVNVGSWVFDPDEFREMKRAIEEDEAREGKKRPERIVEQRDVDENDDDDYRTSPVHSPHISPSHTPHIPPPSSALPPSVSTPPFAASSFVSSSSSSSLQPLPGPNPRKQSHGRFEVTDTYLNTTAAPATTTNHPSTFFTSSTPTPISTSSLPYPTSSDPSSSPLPASFFPSSSAPPTSSPLDVLGGGGGSVSSAYTAMLASSSGGGGSGGGGVVMLGNPSTVSHSRVGRFAVTDEVQHQ